MKIMSEKYDIEDQYAKDALRTAVEVMQVPGETNAIGSSQAGLGLL